MLQVVDSATTASPQVTNGHGPAAVETGPAPVIEIDSDGQLTLDLRESSATAAVEPVDWVRLRSVGAARYSALQRVVKRILDLTVASVLLVLLFPVFLLLVIVIRLDSTGPAFFRQERVGFRERPFTIWKFRTMTTDNDDREHRQFVTAMLRGDLDTDDVTLDEDGQPVFKLVHDPRITRVGAFLRRTSLDELPQLVNIINGSMSLVGPRPSLGYELAEYTGRQRLRASAMPGMTGLWQVEGRNSMSMNEALDLDVRYVRNCSLIGDLVILARTAKIFFRSGH